MQTKHNPLPFAGHTLHRIDFAPETFAETDLLWLPHHRKLSHAGKKRKAEHLAGRIAAFHALGSYGLQHIPDIGDNREPLWPAGLHGSISHCGSTAIAVVNNDSVGIDVEEIFTPMFSDEVAELLISTEERQVLTASGLPFPLALTLAFSTKESVYKAQLNQKLDFLDIKIRAINNGKILTEIFSSAETELTPLKIPTSWAKKNNQIITLTHMI